MSRLISLAELTERPTSSKNPPLGNDSGGPQGHHCVRCSVARVLPMMICSLTRCSPMDLSRPGSPAFESYYQSDLNCQATGPHRCPEPLAFKGPLSQCHDSPSSSPSPFAGPCGGALRYQVGQLDRSAHVNSSFHSDASTRAAIRSHMVRNWASSAALNSSMTS